MLVEPAIVVIRDLVTVSVTEFVTAWVTFDMLYEQGNTCTMKYDLNASCVCKEVLNGNVQSIKYVGADKAYLGNTYNALTCFLLDFP